MEKARTHCKVYTNENKLLLVSFSKIPNFLYGLVSLNISFEHSSATGESIIVVRESEARVKNILNNF